MRTLEKQRHFIVRLTGGLGNQMFQYAFGLALVHRGARVDYDLSWFDGARDGNVTVRQFELERAFNLALPLADRTLVKSWSDISSHLLRRAWMRIVGRKKTHICEQDFGGFGYHPKIWTINSGYLDGYWQSLSYLAGTEDTVRRRFAFTNISDGLNRQHLDAIDSTESVAIHVRRGDFLIHASVHPPLPAQYYHCAIGLMKKRVAHPVFFVFSDDIPWARQNLSLNNTVFVHGNEGDFSFRDMHLMSRCQHLICANSSFSWWAAWLNPRPGRQAGRHSSRLCPTRQTVCRRVDTTGSRKGCHAVTPPCLGLRVFDFLATVVCKQAVRSAK